MNFNVYLLGEVLQHATEWHKEGGGSKMIPNYHVFVEWSKWFFYLWTQYLRGGGGVKEQTEGDLGSVGGLKDRLRDEYMLG
jgi:hypothetical protein